MECNKGFVSLTVILGVFVVLALGGGYLAMNPEAISELKLNAVEKMSTDVVTEVKAGVQAASSDHPEVDRNPDGRVLASSKSSISWRIGDAGEVNGMPQTKVTALINGKAYDGGTHLGSCSEIDASGGVDGTGLIAGELSAVQCWYAGGGKEIGVFANEDSGFDLLVGELSEGDAEQPFFRGDFVIKTTIQL